MSKRQINLVQPTEIKPISKKKTLKVVETTLVENVDYVLEDLKTEVGYYSNPTWFAVMTEESSNRGHAIQNTQAKEMLEVGKLYEVVALEVGEFNSSIKLNSPSYTFNADLFKAARLIKK